MKTELKEIDDCRRSLEIEIDKDKVEAQVLISLRGIRKKIRMPGFRPGKVPLALIQSRYGEEIRQEAMNDLANSEARDFLRQNDIQPASRMVVDKLECDSKGDLQVKISFEVYPNLGFLSLSGIEVTPPAVEVTDETIEKSLENLRQRMSTTHPVDDRPCAEGDLVVISYEGDVEGGGKIEQQSFQYRVNSESDPTGFAAELIGVAKGDQKAFTIRYPEDYLEESLAGKSVRFQVEMEEVREIVVPELDNDFAKEIGKDSLADLRQDVADQLSKRAEAEAEQMLENNIIEQIIDNNPFQPPASVVARELERMVRFELERRGSQGDADYDHVDIEELQRNLRPFAEKNIKSALILDAIAKQEKITLSREEKNAEIKKLSQDTKGQSVKAADLMAMAEDLAIRRKAMAFLKEKLVVEE